MPAQSRGIDGVIFDVSVEKRLLRMTAAAVRARIGSTLLDVLVNFGVQYLLRENFLQLVQSSVLGKHLVWIASRQKLVRKFFLDSRVMFLSFLSSGPRALNS